MAGIENVGGMGIQALSGAAPSARADAPPVAPVAEASSAPKQPVVPTNTARQPQDQEVLQSAGKVQQMLARAAPNLTVSVDQDSGRTVIKVVDPTTHEVLKQIPAEEILRMDKNLDQMIARLKGLLVDRQI